MQSNELYTVLEELGIQFERVEHVPVYTSEQARALIPINKGASAKNLFLRDRKGKRHFLVMLDDEKTLDLARLAEQIGSSRLSLASAERLQEHLGVEAGAVSPLALINDREHRVELWMDEELRQETFLQCHPLVNSATLILSMDDLMVFLAKTGHEIQFVRI